MEDFDVLSKGIRGGAQQGGGGSGEPRQTRQSGRKAYLKRLPMNDCIQRTTRLQTTDGFAAAHLCVAVPVIGRIHRGGAHFQSFIVSFAFITQCEARTGDARTTGEGSPHPDQGSTLPLVATSRAPERVLAGARPGRRIAPRISAAVAVRFRERVSREHLLEDLDGAADSQHP